MVLTILSGNRMSAQKNRIFRRGSGGASPPLSAVDGRFQTKNFYIFVNNFPKSTFFPQI